jgi:hypothetical protein
MVPKRDTEVLSSIFVKWRCYSPFHGLTEEIHLTLSDYGQPYNASPVSQKAISFVMHVPTIKADYLLEIIHSM